MTYRDGETLEALREENERLRKEIEELRGEDMPPYLRDIDSRCRKCDCATPIDNIFNAKGERRSGFKGPDTNYEPAYTPSWLGRLFGKKPRPARMRRNCSKCSAVYYELPKDRSK